MIKLLKMMIHLDILPREVLILDELISNPGICRASLAVNIGFKSSSAVYPALRRLVDRGWVQDDKSPIAGRNDPSILTITANGRGVLTDLQGVETDV